MKSITSLSEEPSAADRSIGAGGPTTLQQRSKERKEVLRPAPDYQVMFVLVALCGLGTLAGFLLQRSAPSLAVALFLGAYLSGGWFASIQLAGELRRGVFDINLLMIVVAIGAACVGAWTEGGTLLFLFSLSNALEQFANYRTEQTISSLLKSAPETACRRENGAWIEVSTDSLGVGDELLVKPGDLFPVDGEVLEGATSADESALTGEALPISKHPGDSVSGGTVNLEGQAVIRVRRLPSESAVQRIIDLIESAREQKAPAQRFTDAFTRYYTVIVLVGSVAFFAWLLLWLREPFSQAIYRMMTLLVVASPCALVLSIPSAILVAIASGARQGILFRGGVAVESLAGVNHFAFDKTGTLTTGQLQVARVEARGADLRRGGARSSGRSRAILDPSPFPRCRGGGETPRSQTERSGRGDQHSRFRRRSDDRRPTGRCWQSQTDGRARLRRLRARIQRRRG